MKPTKVAPVHATVESTEVPMDAHAEGAEHHGLLQDPGTWIAVSFVLFFVLAAKYVFPLIGKGLDDRAAKIREQLEQASRLREEAEALLAQYKVQQEEKLKEAESILATAKKDAEALRTRAAEELKVAIERRGQQAQEKIARAEMDAVAQIRNQIIDMATNTARARIEEQLKSQEDPAISRALAAIERQIH